MYFTDPYFTCTSIPCIAYAMVFLLLVIVNRVLYDDHIWLCDDVYLHSTTINMQNIDKNMVEYLFRMGR